jgi:hypothetical protein
MEQNRSENLITKGCFIMTKYEELLSMLLEGIKSDIEHVEKVNKFIDSNYEELMTNEKAMRWYLEFKAALKAVAKMKKWTTDDLDRPYEDLVS